MRNCKICIAFILITLTACAPTTVQGLRENPAGRLVFEASENYQPVYRKILTTARDCWQQGASLATAQVNVQADIHTDLQKATISVILLGPALTQTFMTIDIDALSINNSRVTVYYAFRASARRAQAVELWVKQNSPICEIPASSFE